MNRKQLDAIKKLNVDARTKESLRNIYQRRMDNPSLEDVEQLTQAGFAVRPMPMLYHQSFWTVGQATPEGGFIEYNCNVDPTAKVRGIVLAHSTVGANSQIDGIIERTSTGEDCLIEKNSAVDMSTLGNNVKIRDGKLPNKWTGRGSSINESTLEDDVQVNGAWFTTCGICDEEDFSCDEYSRNSVGKGTIIGNSVMLASSWIGSNCIIKKNCELTNIEVLDNVIVRAGRKAQCECFSGCSISSPTRKTNPSHQETSMIGGRS